MIEVELGPRSDYKTELPKKKQGIDAHDVSLIEQNQPDSLIYGQKDQDVLFDLTPYLQERILTEIPEITPGDQISNQIISPLQGVLPEAIETTEMTNEEKSEPKPAANNPVGRFKSRTRKSRTTKNDDTLPQIIEDEQNQSDASGAQGSDFEFPPLEDIWGESIERLQELIMDNFDVLTPEQRRALEVAYGVGGGDRETLGIASSSFGITPNEVIKLIHQAGSKLRVLKGRRDVENFIKSKKNSELELNDI